jgi:hypothetical protein
MEKKKMKKEKVNYENKKHFKQSQVSAGSLKSTSRNTIFLVNLLASSFNIILTLA